MCKEVEQFVTYFINCFVSRSDEVVPHPHGSKTHFSGPNEDMYRTIAIWALVEIIIGPFRTLDLLGLDIMTILT